MSVIFYDRGGVTTSETGQQLPATNELRNLHQELSASHCDVRTIAGPDAVLPSGNILLVVHPEAGYSDPFSVTNLIRLASTQQNIHVLLVSSSPSSLIRPPEPMPSNIRFCLVSYHRITANSIAALAGRIRDGRGWDESCPLLRQPLLDGCLALYLLFIAGLNPTPDSHRALFSAAAIELAAPNTVLDLHAITRERLRAALQSSFS